MSSDDDSKNILNFSELKDRLKQKHIRDQIDIPVNEENTSVDDAAQHQELIYKGLDEFFKHLENGVTGFITFSFNDMENIVPEVVIAGDIDPLRAMGALTHISNGFSNAIHMEEFMKQAGDASKDGIKIDKIFPSTGEEEDDN